MNQSDLSLFQQAVGLAQAGQKQAAYAQLRSLVQNNSSEPNLWLWMAFTAPSLAEAEQSLTYLQRLDPYNPHLAGALSWLQAEKQKYQVAKPQVVAVASPVSATVAPQPATLPENPQVQRWRTTASDSSGLVEKPTILNNPYDIAFLIGLTVVGGIVLGVITGAVAQLFYLIFLFPLLMGLGGAFIILGGFKLSKVRTLTLGIGLAILISLVTYSAYQYTEYLFFRQTIKSDLKQEGYVITDTDIDEILQKQVGTTGFVGFLRINTKVGVTLTRLRSGSDSGLTLKGDWVWLYWILELLGIAFFAVRRVMKVLEGDQPQLTPHPIT